MKLRTYSPVWSHDHVRVILAMKEAGCSFAQMGVAVGRSAHACKEKLRQLARRKEVAPKPQGVKRPCLCCERPFLSAGKGNRLCENCKRSSNLDYVTPHLRSNGARF